MQLIIKNESYYSSTIKAFLISILLHIIILSMLEVFKKDSFLLPEQSINVKLLNPTKPEENRETKNQQIVSTEKQLEELPKNETNLKSEFNNRVEKESIKKGDPLAKVATPIIAKQKSPENKQNIKQRNATSANLKLSDDKITASLTEKTNPANEKTTDDNLRENKFETLQPFSKSSIPNIYSKFGSADYLPEIPDGDLTLLNTKADHFAVFVKRVGLQVFGALRKLSWQELPKFEIVKIKEFSEVEAILDTKGKLLELRMRGQSGSTNFDQILKDAGKLGAWDQNPPAGALAYDGKIHFVFKSKTWSRFSQNGIGEQRWLLLGVGLL